MTSNGQSRRASDELQEVSLLLVVEGGQQLVEVLYDGRVVRVAVVWSAILHQHLHVPVAPVTPTEH
jgi:hypothetical protein